MSTAKFIAYNADYRAAVLDLTIAAWTPVFAKTRHEVPAFVYDAFYPEGWQARQIQDVGALLDEGAVTVMLLVEGDTLLGFVGYQIHPEDMMGSVHIVAVTPHRQGEGLGQQLMTHAEEAIKAAGMAMAMVETVGDSGHAPARAAYEARGYESWPVARYFKRLD